MMNIFDFTAILLTEFVAGSTVKPVRHIDAESVNSSFFRPVIRQRRRLAAFNGENLQGDAGKRQGPLDQNVTRTPIATAEGDAPEPAIVEGPPIEAAVPL